MGGRVVGLWLTKESWTSPQKQVAVAWVSVDHPSLVWLAKARYCLGFSSDEAILIVGSSFDILSSEFSSQARY